MTLARQFELLLRDNLPPHLHDLAAVVAPLLADAAQGALSVDELRARLAANDRAGALSEALAGRTVNAPSAVLSFGGGANVGDVTVGDVAGRDLIKINLIAGTMTSIGPQLRRPATIFLTFRQC